MWPAAKSAPPRARSKVAHLAAPIGGWNAVDATPEVSAVRTANRAPEALLLDNWIADIGGVELRRGYTSHGTGLTGSYVESLFEYGGRTTNKLFAATPTTIYDVTAAGAGVSSLTGLTNGRWQRAMLSNSAGTFLYIANGADTPRYYDGTSWTTSLFTGAGLTTANLITVNTHMNRLWFIEKDTFNVWYGPTSAISGTLTKWDLGGLFRKGGSLQAMGTWTRDGGNGPDDYAVFITTKGEVAVYAGTDPSSSTTSALQGVYSIPEPVGRRCMIKAGGDVAILTSLGVVSGSQMLATAETGSQQVAITSRIAGAFRASYALSGTAHGWQIFEYPKANLVIVNVPQSERATQHQYVMNTLTGAWSRFTNINAGCWALLNGVPYFGGNDGTVYKWDTGYLDNGANIVASVQTAYSNFNTPQQKKFNLARPYFLAPASYIPRVHILTDYNTNAVSLATIAVTDQGTLWDVGDWDTSSWGSEVVSVLPWEGLQSSAGVAASVAFSVSASSRVVFNGCDVVYEVGGML